MKSFMDDLCASGNENVTKFNQGQHRDNLVSNETTPFISSDELTQSMNLQRELRKLRFENPGEAMIEDMKNKHTIQRPKRRVTAKVNVTNNYKPFHDRHGNFVTSTGKTIDLCDCLNVECPGCHRPCRKCGSQKCSFQCRSHRCTIVEDVEVQGNSKVVRNLYLPQY